MLLWKILFRVAFGGFILLQFVLFALLLWALSLILPEDNRVVTGTFIVLTLISPFAIGAASHFAFQRFTLVEYILAESERWLADRRKKDVDQIRRCNRLRRWALWIPALSVLLFCLFLDDSWPPTSHLLNPTAGRLIGYTVSLPLTWAIVFSEPGSGSHAYRSYVLAFRSRRLFRGSVAFFLGKATSVSVSSMSFWGSEPEDEVQHPWRPGGKQPKNTRSFKVGNTDLNCEEFVMENDQELSVQCTTPHGDLSCNFSGDRSDSAAFYAILEDIKKRNR